MYERGLMVLPVLFFLFWLILNARVTLEVAVIGILVSAVVSLLVYRFAGLGLETEKKLWLKFFPVFIYLALLVVEVIKANIQMIQLVLSPVIDIRPQIIFFDSPVRSGLAQVALANSITLTPGTITFMLEDGRYGVHTIDAPMGAGIDDSVFVHRLKKIEGGH